MRLHIVLVFTILLSFARVSAAADEPLLVHSPTLSKTQIVFVYGGYLWSVPREGGEARQLTTGGHETTPTFSPDGHWIAFTGQYDGNIDAFVMPADGGSPRRLTWHPGPDIVRGWTPDSKRVLFDSAREAYADFDRLYTVPVEGGWPEVLPMWRGEAAWFSPDAKRIAYVPNLKWQTAWKRYKGGQTTPIFIVQLDDLKLEKVPRQNSNDDDPVWFGDVVYFLSDRNGAVSLFGYDTKSKAVKQVVENKGLDLKSLSAGPDALVYEQFGEIFTFDPRSGKSAKVEVHVSGDLPATRPHYEKVGDKIENAAISPSGARAVFEARGEILSVPGEKGDVRNLTRTTGVAERDPAWSPDGKSIAFFSDESGEYALHIEDQSGAGAVKKINLGSPPSYFYGPVWSPDRKKIAYTDKRLNFWYVAVEKGTPVKVDSDRYEDPSVQLSAAWSPDSKWLTYSKFLESHLRAIFVYSLDTAKVSQVTASIGDARYPGFDKSGKYLFFAASTDVGLSAGWLDLSSYQHPVLRSVYALVLKAGDKSPVEPESDEEKAADAKSGDKKDADKSKDSKDADKDKDADKKSDDKDKKDDKKKDEPAKTTIDLDGIEQRIVSLPIKPANYVDISEGKEGVLFLSEVPDVPRFERGPQGATVSKFDLKTRKTEPFLGAANGFAVSANGEKVLYRQGPGWFIAATAAAPKPGDGALKTSAMEVYVDPRVEWNQMYRETWRIQRDFLYDPGHHGLNLAAAEKKYARYLKNLGGRADLNYLFDEMLGE
ncbi:MAG: PD40 domain-containing protein, partial [Acidobacteria bacterium]|nr:PD40 domain-containing protein [Acidobacteriota bacterium]